MRRKLALVDSRSSCAALSNLSKYAEEVLPFKSVGVTYESISCHPDVFVYQDESGVVLAPNSPKELTDALERHSVNYEVGAAAVGYALEESCMYNCVSSESCVFHKKGYTEESVVRRNLAKRFVNLPQAYARCSMIALPGDVVVTSDRGIEKSVLSNSLECFYFAPEEIRIKVHKYGFFGGTCGWLDEKRLLFNGNPLRHSSGKELYRFLEKHDIEPIALCDDYLYDGGGIFFI